MKLKWTEEDDEICCKVCIKKYVVNRCTTKVSDCIYDIKQYPCMKNLSEGSIRCKIQNIKALLDSWHVENSIPVAGRANASQQNMLQLQHCLEEEGIAYKAYELRNKP